MSSLSVLDNPDKLLDMVDEYRSGRDASELLAYLGSSDPELISNAAWVLSEIAFEFYDTTAFASRLWDLTYHPQAGVRFNALRALFPVLQLRREEARILLERMRNDSNEGVRMAARAAWTRLSY